MFHISYCQGRPGQLCFNRLSKTKAPKEELQRGQPPGLRTLPQLGNGRVGCPHELGSVDILSALGTWKPENSLSVLRVFDQNLMR
jgi:hypothetical protein